MNFYLLQEDGVSRIILENATGLLLLDDGFHQLPPMPADAIIEVARFEDGYQYGWVR